MFSRRFKNLCCTVIKNRKLFHTSVKLDKRENPIWRTIRILSEDLQLRRRLTPTTKEDYELILSRQFPRHADIVIIGGGAIGSAIAYWIKLKSNFDGVRVVVLDKDPTFSKCTTAISMGGLKQQFYLSENIQMAAYGAEFLRLLKKNFGSDANVNFDPAGYLLLASEEGAPQMIDNIKLQQEFGAKNTLLTPEQLQKRFPYLNVSDIALGSLGLEKEGWFNAWEMLTLLRKKSADLGAQYITAEAVDFIFQSRDDVIVDGVQEQNYKSTNEIVVKLPNEETTRTIQFSCCIIAAGHESTNLGKLAGIGAKEGMLSVPLPIEKRKRFVYSFNCNDQPPSINTPMIEDYAGINFRREGLGGSFIVGASPHPDFTPSSDSEEDKKKFFNDIIHPCLSRRVSTFKDVQLTGSWSGDYDFNVYDGNGIIGPHPYFLNLYLATGFSDQGIQLAPAIGRAVSEMILDGSFQTIDLTRLGFDRLIIDTPMFENRVT